MKATRRHDLKTNALSRALDAMPEIWRLYGGRILLVVLAILIAFLFFRFRSNAARDRAAANAAALNSARGLIRELEDTPARIPEDRISAVANLLQRVAIDAEAAIDEVLNNTDDPQLRADAHVARGDLYWNLLRFPKLPFEVPPELRIEKTKEEMLSNAESAYQNVLVDASSASPEAVVAARFGLAAVAEERRDWETAERSYRAIVDDPAAEAAFKDQAVMALRQLPSIRRPVLIAPETQPTTRSSTRPTTTTRAATTTSALE